MDTNDNNNHILSIALRMCDVLYDEKVQLNGHRSLLGSIHLQLKKETESSVNKTVLESFRSKGKTKRRLSHHQICQGASQYALQFHLLEGYSSTTSKKLGCLLWNDMNNVRYFNVDHDMIYNDSIDKLSSKGDVLMRMCRYHHLRVDYGILKTMTTEFGKKNNIKVKARTFWACYKDALRYVSVDTKTISEDMINYCLKKWNEEQNVNLFSV